MTQDPKNVPARPRVEITAIRRTDYKSLFPIPKTSFVNPLTFTTPLKTSQPYKMKEDPPDTQEDVFSSSSPHGFRPITTRRETGERERALGGRSED